MSAQLDFTLTSLLRKLFALLFVYQSADISQFMWPKLLVVKGPNQFHFISVATAVVSVCTALVLLLLDGAVAFVNNVCQFFSEPCVIK